MPQDEHTLTCTITNLFRHGFVRAFNPTVEGTVRAANVLPSGKSVDGQNVSKNLPEKPPEKK